MSVINTIKGTAKKVLTEGYKQYPEGMSRQEYNELKAQIEKELEMTEEVKEGWVMLGPVGGKGTHDFAGDKRQGYRTFTTDKSKFFKKKTTKLSGDTQSTGPSPAEKKSRFDEEVDQIDEISTKAKLDYIRAASGAAVQHAMHKGMDIANRKPGEQQGKAEKDTTRKLMNRQSGIQRAARMLSKEETENVDESRYKGPARPKLYIDTMKAASKFSMSNIRQMERDEKERKEREKREAEKKMAKEEAVREELKGNQHKIDANKNNKIDAHDFKLLRKSKMKEEVETLEEMPSARALNKGTRNRTIDAASKNNKMKGMKSYTLPGTMSKAALSVLAAKAKAAGKGGKIQENMLDEGRGRPPKEGSAAWHRAQAAKQGDEGETQEADKNIHTQLHKVISAKKPVTFNNGKTHEISPAHAHKALALLQNSKPSERLALQHSLSHSHDRFHETIKTGKAVTEPAKPKVSLAKRVSEAVDPTTTAADKRALVVFKKRDKDGVLRVHSRSGGPSSKDIVDAMREQVEITESTKTADIAITPVVSPKLNKANMAADSMKKYEKDPLFSKIKMKLPATQGNKAIGGEEQVHTGKFSMEEEKILNNLYNDLSEENKELFEELTKTEEGIAGLIKFAIEQGYV